MTNTEKAGQFCSGLSHTTGSKYSILLWKNLIINEVFNGKNPSSDKDRRG